jgi:UDP-N-acetyl-D-mannosaminuronate dehydrogenase
VPLNMPDACEKSARCTKARVLYGAIIHRTVPVSSPAAAEMTELLENIYRCVNIALVNELKLLCLGMDIDIWDVIAAASTKPFAFIRSIVTCHRIVTCGKRV